MDRQKILADVRLSLAQAQRIRDQGKPVSIVVHIGEYGHRVDVGTAPKDFTEELKPFDPRGEGDG